MTVRPIAFTGAMVTALLEGRKTQTRRVVSRMQGLGAVTEFGPSDTPGYDWHCRDKDKRWHDLRDHEMRARLPYAVGDLLYVRECWRARDEDDDRSPAQMLAVSAELGGRCQDIPRLFEADGALAGNWDDESDGRLRAAMHMPRMLSRLTLKVTDVRVERVKHISEADAVREGLKECSTGLPEDELRIWGTPGPQGQFDPELAAYTPREAFRRLWDSINSKRGYGWDENPWVIAISFEVIRQNVDDLLAAGEGE